jgi:hypothetical protein
VDLARRAARLICADCYYPEKGRQGGNVVDWVIAGALLVFIVAMLVGLKRYENNRNRKPGG